MIAAHVKQLPDFGDFDFNIVVKSLDNALPSQPGIVMN
jgi:hypothetical protein